jgi:hypothetical protein
VCLQQSHDIPRSWPPLVLHGMLQSCIPYITGVQKRSCSTSGLGYYSCVPRRITLTDVSCRDPGVFGLHYQKALTSSLRSHAVAWDPSGLSLSLLASIYIRNDPHSHRSYSIDNIRSTKLNYCSRQHRQQHLTHDMRLISIPSLCLTIGLALLTVAVPTFGNGSTDIAPHEPTGRSHSTPAF